MIKLLKQYKFVVLTLCIGILGTSAWIYEGCQGDTFILQHQEEETMLTEVLQTSESLSKAEVIDKDRAMDQNEAINTPEVQEVPITVPVYICGEIESPGVYYVSGDTIIHEVIEISGGFTEQADREFLNLASKVQAHEKIVVPKQGEEIDKTINSYENREDALLQEESHTQSHCININTASIDELTDLPGIGEVKAKAILAYREEIGGFKSIEELSEVNGIGDKTLEKIKQLITIY